MDQNRQFWLSFEMKQVTLEFSLLNFSHVDLGLTIRGMSEQIQKKQILIFSDDSSVRAAIISSLGRRTADDLPEHIIHEFATGPALRSFIDGGASIDLFILDGESAPEGGLGIARALKDELFNCPPVMVITGRVQDSWLAAWSLAEASVVHPIDPFTLAQTAARLLRGTKLVTA